MFFTRIGIYASFFIFFMFFIQNASLVFADQKIAVINMQKIVKQSEKGRSATAELEKKFEGLKKDLQAEQDRIKTYKEDIEKKASLLSDEAKAQKEIEYRKMLRDFKDSSENAQFQMKQAEARVMEPLLKSLEKIVNKVAESGGYTMILESNMPGIYYFAPAIDITAEVIKIYDQEPQHTSKSSSKGK
jgi:outer membrane protein